MDNQNNHKPVALVVEDNDVSQQLMGIFLEKLGFASVIAQDGAEALSKVKEVKCDVIFLDIMIPVIDGYEVCKNLKASPETKDIPVIMLTSNDGFFDKIKGKKAGASVYLTKPIQYEKIQSSLKKLFPNIREV